MHQGLLHLTFEKAELIFKELVDLQWRIFLVLMLFFYNSMRRNDTLILNASISPLLKLDLYASI